MSGSCYISQQHLQEHRNQTHFIDQLSCNKNLFKKINIMLDLNTALKTWCKQVARIQSQGKKDTRVVLLFCRSLLLEDFLSCIQFDASPGFSMSKAAKTYSLHFQRSIDYQCKQMYCAFKRVTGLKWLCVLIMPHRRFRVNIHYAVAWISKNSSLKTNAMSEV